MLDAFLSTCRSCGKTILMIRCSETGKWFPCNPKQMKFIQAGGPDTYINENGKYCHGKRDHDGEKGYRLHRKDCFISI